MTRAGVLIGAALIAITWTARADAPVHVKLKIERAGQLHRIEVERASDGSYAYVVAAGDGTKATMTPDQFSAWLLAPKTAGNWLFRFLNVSSAVGLAWVALGMLGQSVFAARMLVQWMASERLGRSIGQSDTNLQPWSPSRSDGGHLLDAVEHRLGA